MNKLLLKIEHLNVSYDNKLALIDACLTIHQNEFIGVIGPNGGGKTTLVRALLGLIKVQSGVFTYYDKNGDQTALAPVIGYLPQYTNIDRKFPISLKEMVHSGLPQYMPKLLANERVRKQIEQVGLLHKMNAHISEMSGGELQRGLLARALVSEPDLLILDEPGTYIDQRYKSVLMQLLEEIRKTCSILLISHDIGTIVSRVETVVCVHQELHVHTAKEINEEVLIEAFGCPFELIGHADLPHRVLKRHS